MPPSELTWGRLHADTATVLGSAVEARWVCETAAGAAGDEWALLLPHAVPARAVACVEAMVARRRAGEPLQYVLGAWAFRTVDLAVDRRVLIPRPETEQVVEVALTEAEARARAARRGGPAGRRPLLVADLGTGSGAIAIALVCELPLGAATVWATDVSPDALAVASANLAGAGRPAAQVRLAEGSWYAALPADAAGCFDLVVANPPYVATGDDVGAEVREWEPPEALFAGADGLDALQAVIAGAPQWLTPGGVLVCEIGAEQGDAVRALAAAAGLADVDVRPDLAGRDRILVARRVA